MHYLKVCAAVGGGTHRRNVSGQQLESQSVCFFTDAAILNECVINVPQDERFREIRGDFQ
jgi:hypothetical protein